MTKKSGVRGVHYDKERDFWCAEIKIKRGGKTLRVRKRVQADKDGLEDLKEWLLEQRSELGVIPHQKDHDA